MRRSVFKRVDFLKVLRSPYFWAVLVRVASLAFPLGPLRGDAFDFQAIAHNLASGIGFSRCPRPPYPLSADRPPLYPLLYAALLLLDLRHALVPWLLNGALDLLGMHAAGRFSRAAKLKRPTALLWLIAFWPLLIIYGRYPLSESMGIWLFFLSAAYLFEKRTWAAGISLGMLALARSYFVLLPFWLLLFRPDPKWRRSFLALVAGVSVATAVPWVIRNFWEFGRPLYSQGGTASFQSYVGLCHTNFSWWDIKDYEAINRHPVFGQAMYSQCLAQDQIMEINRQGWEAVAECVREKPLAVVGNTLVKLWILFVDWGQVLPYNPVPWVVRMLIDAIALAAWLGFAWMYLNVLDRRRPVVRFAMACLGYMIVVTLPFGIDARYNLAPMLLCLALALETTKLRGVLGRVRSLRKGL